LFIGSKRILPIIAGYRFFFDFLAADFQLPISRRAADYSLRVAAATPAQLLSISSRCRFVTDGFRFFICLRAPFHHARIYMLIFINMSLRLSFIIAACQMFTLIVCR